MSNVEVQAVDYHRNGVMGEGFYVALVFDHELQRQMLCISFDDPSRFAVIDPAQACLGNIYMHEREGEPLTGGNAWRGDTYSEELYADIRERQERFWDKHIKAEG